MDHAAFFSAVRAKPFGGSLQQRAVDGLSALLLAFVEHGDGDRQKLAYILGTAFHESDRFRTMEEYASGAAYEGRGDLGNTQSGDGKRFKGRGFVQITGRRNYKDWSDRLDLDLVANPALAEQTSIAARICVEGMLLGTFTGRKLGQYVHDGDADYREARRVVNGTDRAETIAGYAKLFDGALVAARYGTVDEPEPSIVVSEPAPAPIVLTPAPEVPAPAPVPAPTLQPTASTGGPTSKATGGLVGAGLPNVILLLLVKVHAIPADVASDPETILLLTTLLTAAGAWLGAYLAPRNATA